MRKITIVCRANEIRSRVVEAFLSKQFPSAIVKSFGVDVNEKNQISRSLILSMDRWGLTIDTNPPRKINSDLKFVFESDLVIAADSVIADEVREFSNRVIDLTEYSLDTTHIPSDPINFNRLDTQINNAKLIHCVIRILNRNYFDGSGSNITAMIPLQPTSISVRDFEGYVIDARLKHFEENLDNSGTSIFFNGEMLYSGELEALVSERHISFIPSGEFNRPEQALLSTQWCAFVRKVSSLGPTVVITTPRGAGNMKYPDSYIASALAGSAMYI
jgi:protein-tyrosine-phosphatase